MRIYLNNSALNRPFDDHSVARTRREADDVTALLDAIERGRAEWVGSTYLDFEIDQNPDRERARRIRVMTRLVAFAVGLSPAVILRAIDLQREGFRGLDALHVASAELARADVLVTTDDKLLRRAGRAAGKLRVRVVAPAQALSLLHACPPDDA